MNDYYKELQKIVHEMNTSKLIKTESDRLFDYAKTHCSSDIIELDPDTDYAIKQFWINSIGKSEGYVFDEDEDGSVSFIVPSDILFSDTVPLKDITIKMDERSVGSALSTYRIIIFDENERKRVDGDFICVGAMIYIDAKVKDVVMNLYMMSFIYIYDGPDEKMAKATFPFGYDFRGEAGKRGNESELYDIAMSSHAMQFEYLSTWYGIQLALLHPVVKNIFTSGQHLKRRAVDPDPNTRKSDRATKYIKYHKIFDKNFVETAYENSGIKYERKTLCWWVIGHPRTYKNGKKIFIKGYWKGPLRETKSGTRKREIVLNEGGENDTEK